MAFRDRAEAGAKLGELLRGFSGPDAVVLGLPRGGVVVAFEVAKAIGAPLDIIVVRKLGVPYQPELAMGAIGEDGVRILNDEVIRNSGVDKGDIDAAERRERVELSRQARRFRNEQPRIEVSGKVAIIVDDGIATGSTARAACEVARAHGASRVVLAVPIAPRQSIPEMRHVADEVVCLATPEPFFAVGEWYSDFSQTSDAEVVALLNEAADIARDRTASSSRSAADPATAGPQSEEVVIEVGKTRLEGDITLPRELRGFVVFAHGSGSSRHSPRNNYVSGILNDACLGTLLFDLLTEEEGSDRRLVFDIDLLAGRLAEVTLWLVKQLAARGLGDVTIGYFGASTGAAAALEAAAALPGEIGAVVSRGGRPDLAASALGAVRAPTLLIVGGDDDVVLDLNRQALALLTCEAKLAVVPGATHLFEEAGTLEAAAALARDWFLGQLGAPAGPWPDHQLGDDPPTGSDAA